jgi:hypothetical protein
MQTTVFARGRILPRAHDYVTDRSHVSPFRSRALAVSSALLAVERPDQKILDLGLALFHRANPSVGVGESVVDPGDIVLECGHVGFELPLPFGEFSLVGSECVDSGKHCSIVGLAGLQSGDPRLKIFQRSHGCILSGGSGAGGRECGSLAVGSCSVEGGL